MNRRQDSTSSSLHSVKIRRDSNDESQKNHSSIYLRTDAKLRKHLKAESPRKLDAKRASPGTERTVQLDGRGMHLFKCATDRYEINVNSVIEDKLNNKNEGKGGAQ
uniref:Uncharacterized protein n=1 Tax=Onchocerca volvulus TaxID=6282 RepID=A0A8R1U0B0_ONCVO